MKMPQMILLGAVIFSATLVLGACTGSSGLAKSQAEKELRLAIKQDNWIFYAENVNPQKGQTRHLSPFETAYVHRDTLNANLPYFGEAYAGADVLTNQSPLGFISTDFTAIRDRDKRGAWLVTLRPNDYKPVQSLVMTVFDNGSAQMIITLTNRSPISFNGHVKPRS